MDFAFDGVLSDANAAMAQLVERVLGKDEVISSTLISSSRHPRRESPSGLWYFYGQKQPSGTRRTTVFTYKRETIVCKIRHIQYRDVSVPHEEIRRC